MIKLLFQKLSLHFRIRKDGPIQYSVCGTTRSLSIYGPGTLTLSISPPTPHFIAQSNKEKIKCKVERLFPQMARILPSQLKVNIILT